MENSKEKSEQTKQYYQAQANNLKAQLAAIKEDIAAQQQSIELKNAEVAEKAANVAYNKSMFESRLKGMYEMSRGRIERRTSINGIETDRHPKTLWRKGSS